MSFYNAQKDFASNYWDARSIFRTIAKQCGASIEAYPISKKCADGILTIDIALFGDRSAKRSVIVSSGLHGVEGFVGSAIQAKAMVDLHQNGLVEGVQYLFIHALNPYGFAHLRRTNEDNIDPNRNFGTTHIEINNGSVSYQRIDSFLNPAHDTGRLESISFYAGAVSMIGRFGKRALQQTIAQGQTSHPKGLFYAGKEKSDTVKFVKENMEHLINGSKEVIHMDLHSGLGQRGDISLLLDGKNSGQYLRALQSQIQNTNFKIHDHDSETYQAHGTMGKWCANKFIDRKYLFICVEFGTYSSMQVLKALRSENQVYHWGHANNKNWQHAKDNLVECFFPQSASWRQNALSDGVYLVNKSALLEI